MKILDFNLNPGLSNSFPYTFLSQGHLHSHAASTKLYPLEGLVMNNVWQKFRSNWKSKTEVWKFQIL